MSAQITIERKTIEERAAYVDALGYAYCAACKPERHVTRWRNPDGTCDQCGKDIRGSTEIIDGTAIIEQIPVRIF